jgi:hypothetical protein
MLSRRSNGSSGQIHASKEKKGEKEKEGAPKFGDSLLPTAHARGSASGETLRQKLRDGRMSISHLSRGDLMKLANRRGSGMDRERVKNIRASPFSSFSVLRFDAFYPQNRFKRLRRTSSSYVLLVSSSSAHS